ncbi:MAG: DUF3892 domain-containing protein [Sphingomonadales bacterium]
MTVYYVDCIRKDNRNDPYTSIGYLGGGQKPNRWHFSQAEVIQKIKNGDEFWLQSGLLGSSLEKLIISLNPSNKEYVKTYDGGEGNNTLLSLPCCLSTDLFALRSQPR